MRVLGTVAILLVSGCLFAAPNQPQEATPKSTSKVEQPPQAFITSDRVVYRAGEPIDVTFSITLPKAGSIVPGFRVENKDGEAVGALMVGGRDFSSAPGKSIDDKQRAGAIPASEDAAQWTERIADLRQWFDLDAIGLYSIVFDGQWIDEKKDAHPVKSNVIHLQLAGPAGEFELDGEPIEPRIIPLSEIWALDMPGTKPMKTSISTGGFVAPEGSIVAEIRREALQGSKNLLVAARQGFVVRGSGMEALHEAHRILVAKEEPNKVFRRGEEVTLVFFSKSSGLYVHLHQVVAYGEVIEVVYKLVSHMTDEATSHLALIPLDLDRTGMVQVTMTAIIPGHPLNTDVARHIDRTIAKSFEFQVVE